MRTTLFSAKTVLRTIVLCTLVLVTAISMTGKAASIDYQTANGLVKISNSAYEVAFSSENGSIAYIIDRATGERISEGSLNENLWSAALDGHNTITSSTYRGQFQQAWDTGTNTLTMTYIGDLSVQVTVAASDNSTFMMQASLTNHTGDVVSSFDFPSPLKLASADIQDALLPMLPGALLSPQFFSEGRSYVSEYPGVMFADYLAVRSTRGRLALYSQKAAELQPAFIGYTQPKNDPASTALSHSYRTWIADGKDWKTPIVTVMVGQDYPTSILSYRNDNGIDTYPSLTDKLGDEAPAYFAAPLYKLDLVVLKLKIAALKDEVIAKLDVPGIVHFVAFQTGGHDHNYPDFIPPDPKWGTTEDFADLVSFLQSKGSLAVPYTNFSWWNINSPTFQKLPDGITLNTIANLKDDSGFPGLESYGPNSGVVTNQSSTFVQDKIAEQHNALLNTIGVDAIFEDQWGARAAPYDFNPAGLEKYDAATAYFAGVLEHYQKRSASKLMTEMGVDVLAQKGIAFMGSNYLWDMLGYRGDTAGVTTYYPMAGMLLRDKVLLYQHDLAAETWTENKDMLRWNLAQGYGLSDAFYDAKVGGLNMDNQWLRLVGIFQKYALANYADELVTSYEGVTDTVKKTTFSTYTVYSNWSDSQPYQMGAYTLPAGGVMTQANDGSVTAGVFTTYNDQPLSDGDHYLVEVRSSDAVQVFQPVGDDTPLHITKPPDWESVIVTAYQYDGTEIGTVDAIVSGDDLSFTYAGTVDGKTVGSYTISSAQ